MKKDIIVIEGTLLGPEEGVTYDGGPTKYQRALDRIEKLQAQVDVMREALEFYSNDINWNETEPGFSDCIDSDDCGKVNLPIGYVGGVRARQALAKIAEIKNK